MTTKQQALPMPAPVTAPIQPGAPLRDCLECGKVFTPEDPQTELCSSQCTLDYWGVDFMQEFSA